MCRGVIPGLGAQNVALKIHLIWISGQLWPLSIRHTTGHWTDFYLAISGLLDFWSFRILCFSEWRKWKPLSARIHNIVDQCYQFWVINIISSSFRVARNKQKFVVEIPKPNPAGRNITHPFTLRMSWKSRCLYAKCPSPMLNGKWCPWQYAFFTGASGWLGDIHSWRSR